MKALIGGGLDYSSPAGYLNAELFAIMVPLIFLIYAIGLVVGRAPDCDAFEARRLQRATVIVPVMVAGW